jgi:hypothetical protein
MRWQFAILAACALLLWTNAASSQDYVPAPVPAAFMQDGNTTFLVDLTTVKIEADYAAGSRQLTLDTTKFELGDGYAGPIAVTTPGNWPTNAWTVEMLIRVPYRSSVLAGTNPIGLVEK